MEVDALRMILLVNRRAMFEFAVTEATLRGGPSRNRPAYTQWVLAVVLEGVAERVSDRDLLQRFAQAVNAKYETDIADEFYDPDVNGCWRVPAALGVLPDRAQLHRLTDPLALRRVAMRVAVIRAARVTTGRWRWPGDTAGLRLGGNRDVLDDPDQGNVGVLVSSGDQPAHFLCEGLSRAVR